jgi:hypothetical protein
MRTLYPIADTARTAALAGMAEYGRYSRGSPDDSTEIIP